MYGRDRSFKRQHSHAKGQSLPNVNEEKGFRKQHHIPTSQNSFVMFQYGYGN